MASHAVHTEKAPAAIGPYSQAIQVGNLLFLSGQIPLDPVTMELQNASFTEEVQQVFRNIEAVLVAAGCTLNDVVKFTVFLTDLSNFETVNEIMASKLSEPYPARSALQVSALPRGASVEIETIAEAVDK